MGDGVLELDEELDESAIEALECLLGDTDLLGYLVRVEGDKLMIKSVLFSSGMCMPFLSPSIDEDVELGILGNPNPMEMSVRKFEKA